MRLSYSTPAVEDLESAAAFYNGCRSGLGAEFVEEVEHSISRIMDGPLTFSFISRDVRRVRVHRFPYDIYFRVEGGVIRILAVKHDAQDDDFWTDRT